jgi:hypothetical protein
METLAPARPFYFDPAALGALARARRAEFAGAKPFPHVVLDDFLPEPVLDRILGEFPSPEDIAWIRYRETTQKKLAAHDETLMGDATRHLFAQLNASVFIAFLEQLTGIDGLIPDPHLIGGGMHQIEPGGLLRIHADFNRHEQLRLDRRLNLLLYLNRDWREEYGGHLELWNRDMTAAARRILPVFNRCVIFATSDYSYHGHPDPLTCPPGRARKSLALYYYSNGRPAGEVSDRHPTLFRARPGEAPALSPRGIAKKLLPPLVADAARAIRGRKLL